jgi:thiamine kinase-like enzyme
LFPDVDKIIAQIPSWREAEKIRVTPLAGLTNTNYAVTVDGDHFVLRISGKNTDCLGINRELEREALMVASQASIGPKVVHFVRPEGHLVTHYIHGSHFELEAYRRKENIQRVVRTVKRLHGLPGVKAVFSSFRRVEKYTSYARTMGISFPQDFDNMIQKMAEIEYQQAQDFDPWRKFCHNDLFCVNVLDDGNIWFIDWEFAGMGDIYYDLATLTYAYDSPDTLSPELQEYLLLCYFGEITTKNRERLAGMKFMLMFFTAMWSLLQQGLLNEGLVLAVEGFDFMAYADTTFEAMRSCM